MAGADPQGSRPDPRSRHEAAGGGPAQRDPPRGNRPGDHRRGFSAVQQAPQAETDPVPGSAASQEGPGHPDPRLGRLGGKVSGLGTGDRRPRRGRLPRGGEGDAGEIRDR